jgi:hypothetical protein
MMVPHNSLEGEENIALLAERCTVSFLIIAMKVRSNRAHIGFQGRGCEDSVNQGGRGTLKKVRPPVFGMVQRGEASGNQSPGQC